jgi:hypothetical protein
MTLPHTQTDELGRSLLAKQGIGAVWNLHKSCRSSVPRSFTQLLLR